jgi:hypothetical protein
MMLFIRKATDQAGSGPLLSETLAAPASCLAGRELIERRRPFVPLRRVRAFGATQFGRAACLAAR